MSVAISKKRYQRRLIALCVIIAANLAGIGIASYNLLMVAEAAQPATSTHTSRLQRVDLDISAETADMLSADLQYLVNTATDPIILEGEIYLDETIIIAEGQNVTIGGDFVLYAGDLDVAFNLAPDSSLGIMGGVFSGGPGRGLGFWLNSAEMTIWDGFFQDFGGGVFLLDDSLLNFRGQGGGFFGNGSPHTNGGVAHAMGNSGINISGTPFFQGNTGLDGGVFHLSDNSSLLMAGGAMLDNTAVRGGGIFVDSLDTLRLMDIISPQTRLADMPMFAGNAATSGTLYHLSAGLGTLYAATIHNDNWSGGMPHGFNNHDINQPGDDFALQFVPFDGDVLHPDAFPMMPLEEPLAGLGFSVPAGDAVGTADGFGEALESLPTPERPGFDFAGWVAGMPDGEQVDFEDLPPNTPMPPQNLAFYARWQPQEFPITFNFGLTPEQEEAFGYLLEQADLPESFNPNQLPLEIELPWLYDWAVDGMEMATPDGSENVDIPQDAPNAAQIPPTMDDEPTQGPLEITPNFVPLEETTPPPPPQESTQSPENDDDDDGDSGGNGGGGGSSGGDNDNDNGDGDGGGNGGGGAGSGGNPQTGDNFALAGLILSIIGLVSSATLLVLLIIKRKIRGSAEVSG